MATAGARTVDLTEAAVFDEVLVNITEGGVNRTRRIKSEAFASQIAASGAVQEGFVAEKTAREVADALLQSSVSELTLLTNAAMVASALGAVAVRDAVAAAQTTALPAFTYANGTLGVGATITINANGALAASYFDNVALTVGKRVWLRLEGAYNGLYIVTAVGSAGAQAILTRAADADTAAEIDRMVFFITGGATLANKTYQCQEKAADITVGTTALTFALANDLSGVDAKIVTGVGSEAIKQATQPNLVTDPLSFANKGSSAVTVGVAADGTPVAIYNATGGGSHYEKVSRSLIAGSTFSAGAKIFLSSTTGRFLIQQYTSGGSEIQDIGDGNGSYRYDVTISAGASFAAPVMVAVYDKPIAPTCAEIRFRCIGAGGVTGMEVGLTWLREKAKAFAMPPVIQKAEAMYIDPAGLGSNAGTSAAPLATLAQAAAAGARRVIVKDGFYSIGALSLVGSQFRTLEIHAFNGAQPYTQGGDHLTGFTAVVGRTDCYEAALATAPVRYHVSQPRGYVFCVDAPFSAISAADRRPVHAGRSHRLQHWPFKPYASLDLLEAASEPGWWYDDPNNKLVVRSVPGVDPLTMTVVVPRTYAIQNLSKQNRLIMSGIQYEFTGLNLDSIARYELEGMTIIGSPLEGLSLSMAAGVDRFCSVMGSSNDNWNGHGTLGDTPGLQNGFASIDTLNHSIEPYSAWAFDDCRSFHERCRGRVDGGLLEFGGSTGSAVSSGAEESLYGTEINACGWIVSAQGGVCVINSDNDDGNGTEATATNVTVRNSPRGFGVKSGALHKMRLFNTRTINCSEFALAADAGCVMDIHRHHDTGSAALFGPVLNPGTFNIDNGTLVT